MIRKIGQFTDSFPPITDGVSNVVENYCKYLNNSYADCLVVTPGDAGEIDYSKYAYEVKTVRYIDVPFRNEYKYGLGTLDRKAYKDLQLTDFDIIHTHSPFSAGVLARKIASHKKIPMVATFHSKYKDDFMHALKSNMIASTVAYFISKFYEKADEVWAVTKSSSQVLRDYGYKGEIYIMQNGCDFEPKRNDDKLNEQINKMYGISSDQKVLLYVGQQIWQKNLELLLKSVAKLKETNKNFKLLMVGGGQNEDEIKLLSSKLKLDDNIIFAGRILDRALLQNVFSRADLFLFPSFYDTSGIVVKEAAASYTPALLMKGANAADDITDGYNGFLCQDNNAGCYSAKLCEIINNQDLLNNAGENAAKTLCTHWREVVKQVYQRYEFIQEKFIRDIGK